MQAIILDTETHTLNGQPIEIAYAPIEIIDHKISLDKSRLFDQLYSCDEPISFAAMAVHHILNQIWKDNHITAVSNFHRKPLISLVTILIMIFVP